MIEVQFVDAPHQIQIGLWRRPRQVVHRGARELQQLRLPRNGKDVFGIDHRFALASSIRPSATAKKSVSIASWPIFACRSFTLGPSALRFSVAVANTSPARSRSWAFHCVICWGWTSKRSESCASVRSPLRAAKATFALKVDEWFRRGRFIASAPMRACAQLEQSCTYRFV